MTVDIRFFASLREVLGPHETVALPPVATVAAVRDALISRGEPYASALDRQRAVRCALNKSLCAETATVQSGDELAFFPPVTGG